MSECPVDRGHEATRAGSDLPALRTHAKITCKSCTTYYLELGEAAAFLENPGAAIDRGKLSLMIAAVYKRGRSPVVDRETISKAESIPYLADGSLPAAVLDNFASYYPLRPDQLG